MGRKSEPGRSPAGDLPPERDPRALYREWWAHDGLWYQAVARRCGHEVANEINRECLRAMATRNMRALVRERGIDRATLDIEGLKELYLEVTRRMWPEEWVETEVEICGPGSFDVKIHKNFALALVDQAGSLEQYDCACLDIREAWFEVLGLEVDQGVCACKRDGSPTCDFWARVRFPERGDSDDGR